VGSSAGRDLEPEQEGHDDLAAESDATPPCRTRRASFGLTDVVSIFCTTALPSLCSGSGGERRRRRHQEILAREEGRRGGARTYRTSRRSRISSSPLWFACPVSAAVSFPRHLSPPSPFPGTCRRRRVASLSCPLSTTENTGLTSWVRKPEREAYQVGRIRDGPENSPNKPEK
jgi:hypothetical protein